MDSNDPFKDEWPEGEREERRKKKEDEKKERSQRDDTQNRRRTTTGDRATEKEALSSNDYSRPSQIVADTIGSIE